MVSVASPVRPRVGHIQFLNCLPIYWGLVRSGALLDVELTKDTPDRLNDMLVAGDLDIGPISLVEYLRHADDLVLLPDVAVGLGRSGALGQSRGAAYRSASWTGAGWRSGRRRARPCCSRACGWPRCTACAPSTSSARPTSPSMLLEADAAVLIGDAALRATYDAPRRGLAVHDLGAVWKQWTGLPMVFAVWAARRDYAEANPGLVKDVHTAFVRSRDDALAHVDEVAEPAAGGRSSTGRRWRPTSAPWTSRSGSVRWTAWSSSRGRRSPARSPHR